MYNPIIDEMSSREKYAVSFMARFKHRFDECIADGAEEFMIKTSDFDAFIYDEGFSDSESHDNDMPRMPRKGDDIWAQFRNESNSIRAELNEASSYALHGEPPYRLDFEGQGIITVRLLTAMFRITTKQMADKMLSLAESKGREFNKMHQYLRDNSGSLPIELQGRISIQDQMFKGVVRRVSRDLADYVEETGDNYKQAVLLLEGDGS